MDRITIEPNAPIAVYLRKSRMEDGGSIEDTLRKHEAEINRFIEANGFTNVTYFREVVSAETIAERPQVKRLLSDIESKKYRAVLAIALDRLTRGDFGDMDTLTKTFSNAGCVLITMKGEYFAFKPETRLEDGIKLLFGNREYETIKARLQAGKRRTFEEGRISTGKPPYGYRKDKNLNKIVIVPEEVDVYLWIVDRYLNGYSTHSIARELNVKRVLAPSGKIGKWSHTYILNLLKNPIHAGFVAINKANRKKVDGRWIVKRKDPHEFDVVQGNHEAIISNDTYEAILQRIKDNVKRPPATRNNSFRLTGLVRCGYCQYSTTVRRKVRADGSEYATIRKCKHDFPDGTRCESNRGINESILVDVLRSDMERYKAELYERKETNKKPKLDFDPVSLQRSTIEEAQSKIDRAKMLFIDGDLSKAEYDSIKQKEMDRIEEAKAKINELSVSPEAKNEERKKVWTAVDIEKMFFEDMDPTEFNRAIRTLVDSISYKYDGKSSLDVDIKYR